jgi:hypothetical protein
MRNQKYFLHEVVQIRSLDPDPQQKARYEWRELPKQFSGVEVTSYRQIRVCSCHN